MMQRGMVYETLMPDFTWGRVEVVHDMGGVVWVKDRGAPDKEAYRVHSRAHLKGPVGGRAKKELPGPPVEPPKPKKRKKKAKPKKKALPKRAPKKLPPAKRGCNRSPCTDVKYDPKLQVDEILAAREVVEATPGRKSRRRIATKKDGTPKGTGKGDKWEPKFDKGFGRPLPRRPFVVAYGLGLDSTAILVGLVQESRKGGKAWVPDAITFADTGAEKDVTYAFLGKMNRYLEANGFPHVTVVAYATDFTTGGWGASRTLEQQCLINHSLPAISENMGRQSPCSSLWKQSPQDMWMKFHSGLFEVVPGTEHLSISRRKYRPKGSGWIVKAIGYDATEYRRLAPDGGGSGATFRTTGRNAVKHYRYWYPLLEWGWDRARCYAEVEAELGAVPPKSSCYFCQAMKPEEIVSLSEDEARRAVLLEMVRKHGRQSYRYKKKGGDPGKGVKGLGGSWSWTTLFVTGAEEALKGKYGLERRAKIDGMVLKRFGRRTILRPAEARRIEEFAKRWVVAGPDQGRSVTLKMAEEFGLGRVDTRYKGTENMAKHPLTRRIEAFQEFKGFRGTRKVAWDRFGAARNPADSAFTDQPLDERGALVDLYGISHGRAGANPHLAQLQHRELHERVAELARASRGVWLPECGHEGLLGMRCFRTAGHPGLHSHSVGRHELAHMLRRGRSRLNP